MREATVGSCFLRPWWPVDVFNTRGLYGYCLIYLDIVSILTDSCVTIIKLVKPFQLP